MYKFNMLLEEELKKKLHIIAVNQNKKMSEIVRELIEKFVKENYNK
jgi:predicted DNA-binding protein